MYDRDARMRCVWLILAAVVLLSLSLPHQAFAQVSAPTITVQPVSQTVNPGTTVTLSVTAPGATTYQWYDNGSPFTGNSASITFSSAQTGVFSFYVVAANSSGYATSNVATLTFAVTSPPAITSASSITGAAGAALSYSITATGLPTSFAATSLPPGLAANPATGVISGTPTSPGAYPVQISATNAFGTTSATLTIAVMSSLYAYEQYGQSSAFYSTTSLFTLPTGIAVAGGGTVYVADQGSNTVRNGAGSVLAGQAGLIGSADGTLSNARFYRPSGVAVNAAGTQVFVTDTGNDTVRVIAVASGYVTTLAGSAQLAGSTDGVGSLATFNGPTGIAVDGAGNAYVADSGNNTIRKITAAGAVSTLAGSPGQSGSADGSGTAARFNNPTGLAVDGAGNVYVADTGNNTIRKISPAGAVSTLAGNPGQSGKVDGSGAAATFNSPSAVVTDGSGDVFVADTRNNVMREILPGGYVVTLSGWLGAYGPPADFPSQIPSRLTVPGIIAPTGLAIDGQGDLYWANQTLILEALPYTPIAITTAPANANVAVGTTGLFSITATGQPLAYAWLGPTLASSGTQTTLLSTSATLAVGAQIGSNGGGNFLYNNGGTYSVNVYNAGSEASASFTVGISPAAPLITGLPSAQTAAIGQNIYLAVVAAQTGFNYIFETPSYSWSFNGTPIPGANSFNYTINGAQPANAGNYAVTVTFSYPGSNFVPISATSNVDTVTVVPGSVPVITTQPLATSVAVGGTATLAVTATGSNPLVYQWYLNGSAITGANGSSYTVTGATAAQAGSYTVTVTNQFQTVTSNAATLSVTPPAAVAPTITTQPTAAVIAYGASTTLSVVAAGTPAPSYQWQLNGVSIAGATAATYPASVPGSYAVVITNSAGSVTSMPVTVSAATRLVDISSRAQVGTGANILIAGFVVAGPPGSTEPVLVRGVGPALAQFGVTGLLAQPVLTLYDANGNALASNTGWGTNSNASQIAAAFTATGAFTLPSNSADSALLANLPPGAYTAEVAGASGATGVALAEVYEVSAGSPELINISTRAFVPSGSGVEIAGIVVTGSQPAKVLVRAVGPALTQFGVSGALAQPSLSVVNSSGVTVGSNTGWSTNANAAAIVAETLAVGAFALPAGSADCALLLTLPPGAYTAVVNGAGNTGGVALVEAYQAP